MLHLSFAMGPSMNFSLTRINDAPEEQDDTSVDVVVLDGLAILYVLKPAATGTFCESHVHDMFLPYV